MTATFGIMDYVVLGGTLVISILIGLYYAFIKKQKTNSDLLLGGQNMAIFPVAMSLLATYMSAILVLGYSGEVYLQGTLISEMVVGCFIFIPLGGVVFLPTLYKLSLTSVYEYLEKRFDSTAVRLIATATFMAQVIMYLGVVLLAPSLALEAMVQFPVKWSMLLIGSCASLYTSLGGFKAVVWTDVFQIIIMLTGMLSIIIQGSINVGGITNVFSIAKEHGRINFLNFDLNPFVRYTSYGIFFGQGVGWLSAFGCSQMTVQRYCSLSSYKRALTALIMTGPLVAITMSFACLCGVVIFANYASPQCDPLSLGRIARGDQIAPTFVTDYLSSIPGLVGLFLACLFSGALSTLSSGINSLAAVFVEDFLKRIPRFNKLSDIQQGMVTKVTGLGVGCCTIGMGFIVQSFSGVFQATVVVNGSVAGPLLGVFVLGILIPFTNKYGAIIGMLVGHVITLWISVGSLVVLEKSMRTLPLSTEGCSDDVWSIYNMTEALERQRKWAEPPVEIEWPNKIYSISYLLYTIIGSTVTVIVGCLVSLCTGMTKLTKNQEPYIHPLIVRMMRGRRPAKEPSRYEFDPSLNIALSHMNMNGSHPQNQHRGYGQPYYDNKGFERT